MPLCLAIGSRPCSLMARPGVTFNLPRIFSVDELIELDAAEAKHCDGNCRMWFHFKTSLKNTGQTYDSTLD